MLFLNLNLSFLLGIIQVLAALGYLVISIAQFAKPAKSRKKNELFFHILQLVFIPLILFLSGIILLFQGWRLDPVLMFQNVLMMILVSYFIVLDLTLPALKMTGILGSRFNLSNAGLLQY